MTEPIKRYGAIGWLLVSPFLVGAALVVDPLPVRGLLLVAAFGTATLGVRVLRKSRRTAGKT